MTRVIEVRVPDMGNFKDVAVIDVLVKPGDTIEPDTPLVTLETEKATMDVPSTVGGVSSVRGEQGGHVSAGDIVVARALGERCSGCSTEAPKAASPPPPARICACPQPGGCGHVSGRQHPRRPRPPRCTRAFAAAGRCSAPAR